MRCLRGEGGRKRYVAPACLLAWCVCVCVEAIRHGERLLRKLEPSSLPPVHTHTHTYIRKDTKTLLLSLSYVGVSSWETAKDLKKGKAQHTHTDRHTDRQRERHTERTRPLPKSVFPAAVGSHRAARGRCLALVVPRTPRPPAAASAHRLSVLFLRRTPRFSLP